MRDLLIIFIILLVLMTLISTLGGSVTVHEKFEVGKPASIDQMNAFFKNFVLEESKSSRREPFTQQAEQSTQHFNMGMNEQPEEQPQEQREEFQQDSDQYNDEDPIDTNNVEAFNGGGSLFASV